MTFADGTTAQRTQSNDGVATTTLGDGTVVVSTSAADPVFGSFAPTISTTTTLPSALRRVEDIKVTVTSPAGGSVYDWTQRVTRKTINNRETTMTFDRATRTHEVLTPMGRSRRVEIDAQGRPVRVSAPGLASIARVYDSTIGTTHTGTYDAQDRLIEYAGATYTYTPDGELLQRSTMSGSTQYEYDVFGNLVRVVLPDGRTITYEIDAMQRRIGKRVDGVRQYGLLYQSQRAPVAVLNASNAVVATFVYGTRSNVPDYMTMGGQRYRFVTDHLGSVRLVIRTADGSVVQRLDYDEFGKVLIDTNPGFQPFGFAGGLYDPDTGLVRFGARDYDAATGRWTAKDPILFGGGSANLYVYVGNDPVNRVDPTGKFESTGALWDFAQTWYWGVRNDGVNDKYYHCLANCLAASRGETGEKVAELLSDLRETLQDQPTASSAEEDQVANRFGRKAGRAICEDGDSEEARPWCVAECTGEFGFQGDGRSTPNSWGLGGSGGRGSGSYY